MNSRRDFVRKAAITAGGFLNLNPRAKGANDRVTLALIGGCNQGRGVALRAIDQGAQFKTFCDLDDEILRKTGGDMNEAQKRMPGFEKDFRRVYNDKDIDAVVIATHGFESYNCLPKRISASGGIYWLDDAKEVPDTEVVSYDYGHTLLNFELRSFAWDHFIPREKAHTDFFTAFYGTEGTLLLGVDGWEVHAKDGKVEPKVKQSGGSHERNFIDSVKSRKKPNSDVEIGRLSTTLCHLGNISYHLGRDVHFDARTETFPGDKQANAMLTKDYRKPYVLPKV